jgi:BirA family transcriptional regulator, biotin operon repressor / biotin---[acetyl-CoA-carboxylase] ligase
VEGADCGPGDLDEAALAPLLTGRLGHPLEVFSSIGSTNAEAARWAAAGAPDGALVVAEHQTAGRGRRGRSWASAPGKLIQFSLVLRRRLPLGRAGLLALALGTACAEGIEEVSGIPARTKWPNDVTVDGLKLAGILIEGRTALSGAGVAVCGVGINHGWRADEIPPDLRDRATSVAAAREALELGAPPPRTEILATVLARLETHLALAAAAPGELVARASERSATLGSPVRAVLPDGRVMEGRAVRLRPDGGLELHDSGGVTRVLSVGEIKHLHAAPRSP